MKSKKKLYKYLLFIMIIFVLALLGVFYNKNESIYQTGNESETLASPAANIIKGKDTQVVSADTVDLIDLIDASMNTASITNKLQELINRDGVKVIVLSGPKNDKNQLSLDKIILKSNKTLILSRGLHIIVGRDLDAKYESAFELVNVDNVKIIGNNSEIEMLDPEEKGESNHIIGIRGSKNLVIDKINLMNAGGDGVCIAADSNIINENILISNCVISGSQRQSISVIEGKSIRIVGSQFNGSRGKKPQSGLDIEPNRHCILENISVENCLAKGNAGSGFQIALAKILKGFNPITITIRNCKSFDNNEYGFVTKFIHEGVKGKIVFDDCVSTRNIAAGFGEVSCASNGIPKFYNNCNIILSDSYSSNFVKSGQKVFVGSGRNRVFRISRNKKYPEFDLGNSQFKNCSVKVGNKRYVISKKNVGLKTARIEIK